MFDGVVDGSFPPRRSCGANRRSRRRYANEHFRHSPVEATAADLIGKLEASVGGGGAAAASSVSSSGRQSQQSEKKKDRRGAAASSVPSSGRQPQQSEKRRTGGGGGGDCSHRSYSPPTDN